MAVVKKVIHVVQEWLEDSNHLTTRQQECSIEEARIKALQMRQIYF